MSQRTAVANRIRATLAVRLLDCPESLATKAGRAWLAAVDVDDDARWLIESDLRLLDAVEAEIEAIGAQLARRGYEDDRVRLLMTLPGVSQHTAQAILAAVGDVSRFSTDRKLASYLGLTPSTRQSATKSYHGPITKAGRKHTRWMLVQAAQAVRKHPGPLGHFFRRLKRKKNHNVAVVAVAHKFACIAWHVLTTGEPYRYALPASTETKLAKLRVEATGKRRKGGVAKGVDSRTLRPAGSQGRAQRGLADVCASEGLPPPAPAPAGELKHLEGIGLQSLPAELHASRILPRASKKTAMVT